MIESFVEIASRKQYNVKRNRCRQWQAARTAEHYPVAWSISYLEGELPPVVEVPLISTCQRRALFQDKLTVLQPAQLRVTPAAPKKQLSLADFTTVCPSNNEVIGGTSISPPPHQITVCTINLNNISHE